MEILAVHAMLHEPLVHTFVPSTDQDEPLVLRQFAHHPVAQHVALRREVDDQSRRPILLLHELERPVEHIHAHHHPLPPAERVVVHRPVPVGRVLPDVVDLQVEQPVLPRPLDDRDIERPTEGIGKQRQDIDSHSTATIADSPFSGKARL